MQIRRITVPTPFPVGPVNSFLLDGDPLTLVDGGPDTAEAWAALEDGLHHAGRRVEDIRRLIITHAHEDHFGLARQVSERSGAEIFAHPWEIPRLLGRRDAGEYRRLLDLAGVPANVALAFQARYEIVAALGPPLETVRPLAAGDRIVIDDVAFEALHTPGHTPGSICLFDRRAGVLIAGDTILADISPNPILNLHPEEPRRRFPSLVRYLETLNRLAALTPSASKTGHGDDIQDLPAHVASHRTFVDARQAKALAALDPAGSTAWEISGRLFPDAGEVHRFLALSEAVANLDLAVVRGAARAEQRNGIERFLRIER